MLHSQRRKAALHRLAVLGPQREILVLCYGNICRSPYAAAVLARQLNAHPGIRVTQGGFFGPGRPSPERAQSAAELRGTDLTRHRSQLLTPELTGSASLVVVMEREQERRVRAEYAADPRRILQLGDLDPEPISSRDILDPYGLSLEVFGTTYARLDRCIGALINALPPG